MLLIPFFIHLYPPSVLAILLYVACCLGGGGFFDPALIFLISVSTFLSNRTKSEACSVIFEKEIKL